MKKDEFEEIIKQLKAINRNITRVYNKINKQLSQLILIQRDTREIRKDKKEPVPATKPKKKKQSVVEMIKDELIYDE